jgi:hypothetical protein
MFAEFGSLWGIIKNEGKQTAIYCQGDIMIAEIKVSLIVTSALQDIKYLRREITFTILMINIEHFLLGKLNGVCFQYYCHFNNVIVKLCKAELV